MRILLLGVSLGVERSRGQSWEPLRAAPASVPFGARQGVRVLPQVLGATGTDPESPKTLGAPRGGVYVGSTAAGQG